MVLFYVELRLVSKDHNCNKWENRYSLEFCIWWLICIWKELIHWTSWKTQQHKVKRTHLLSMLYLNSHNILVRCRIALTPHANTFLRKWKNSWKHDQHTVSGITTLNILYRVINVRLFVQEPGKPIIHHSVGVKWKNVVIERVHRLAELKLSQQR